MQDRTCQNCGETITGLGKGGHRVQFCCCAADGCKARRGTAKIFGFTHDDAVRRGYCKNHYRRVQRSGDPESSKPFRRPRDGRCEHPDGCERPIQARGLCNMHYSRLRASGALGPSHRKIAEKGGPRPTRNVAGYALIWDPAHPNAQPSTGYVMQHVKVMSDVLGRPLVAAENVHHINGVKDDNRPENLELWSSSQPSGQRVADKVEWAKDLLRLYEPDALR